MEGQWWDGGGWDQARRASLGSVQLEVGVYLWGVKFGLCMGVESHFSSVSVCLSLSFSNYIHITHTHTHLHACISPDAALPLSRTAGARERRGSQGGWRGDANRRQIFSRGNAEDCRGDELMNTHHMVNYEREWESWWGAGGISYDEKACEWRLMEKRQNSKEEDE